MIDVRFRSTSTKLSMDECSKCIYVDLLHLYKFSTKFKTLLVNVDLLLDSTKFSKYVQLYLNLLGQINLVRTYRLTYRSTI
eukprot:SAG31_NODE_476_length_15154_cov_24.796878_14_plen_81_part_00